MGQATLLHLGTCKSTCKYSCWICEYLTHGPQVYSQHSRGKRLGSAYKGPNNYQYHCETYVMHMLPWLKQEYGTIASYSGPYSTCMLKLLGSCYKLPSAAAQTEQVKKFENPGKTARPCKLRMSLPPPKEPQMNHRHRLCRFNGLWCGKP